MGAKYTNETLGGLLNASFGNVTELIVSYFALKAGLLRVVQLSMLGSVLSNLLLVLGSAMFVGGLYHPTQKFNKVGASTNNGLLAAVVLALSLPSILDATHEGSVPSLQAHKGASWLHGNGSLDEEVMQGGDAPLWLSRLIAMVLLVLYAALILFQLKTHRWLFDGDDDEDDPGILGFWGGIFWLAVITIGISILSSYIVDAIEGAAKDLHVPILFISGILVPIVGNAAEHAAAVVFASRNKMEIALGSSLGSAVQISVFAIPLCVVMGWIMGSPFSLDFHIFESASLLLTVTIVSITLVDGRGHWLKGLMLIFTYIMISAAFWAHADPKTMS